VFDRQVKSYPDCTLDAEHLLLGNLPVILPQAASRFAGKSFWLTPMMAPSPPKATPR